MIERKSIKHLLADSIKELMNEKPLQKITVQMIADNCHVTRQTFYHHFLDKFDLVNWIFCTNIDSIVSGSPRELPWRMVLAEMLLCMKREQKFYVNAMSCEGQNSFHQFMTEYTRVAYVKELTRRLSSESLSDDMYFSIEFNSYGAVGVIYKWIRNNMSEDPHKLAKSIADNMPQLMKEYFK
jgi:probable dihydroxyacetone kinase regulator